MKKQIFIILTIILTCQLVGIENRCWHGRCRHTPPREQPLPVPPLEEIE